MKKEIDTIYYDDIVDGYNEKWIKKKYEEIKTLPYAFVIINIKNFRYYNETYGISGGNEILRLLYQHLAAALYDDEYIAHVYGDTFVCLLTYKTIDELTQERMVYLFDQVIYRIEDDRIYRNIFASSAIYLNNDKLCSYDEAFNYANVIRLQSENIKERTFCYDIFDQKLYDAYIKQIDLEIKTAQAYKDYEFTSFIQPKVDSKTHKIIGGEALLRWIDKDLKEIPLRDFLPILTSNAYITLVDLDIFELVCQWIDRRIKENKAVVPISFNICKPNFYDVDLIKNYMDIYHKYNIPKHLIQFELMESITLDDMDKMKEVIHAFKQEGFACALDDFGSGYSSFSVLLNAEIETVKLDRQFFLKNLNGDSREIISTVIRLMKSLNLKTVAEGVETKEYADFLAECSCDSIQGYYFYKPLPIEVFEKELDKQHAM